MVITPSGRDPGTSRAERGRSRQPVARITASGWISWGPSGPVSWSGPSGDQRVTIVSVRISTPAVRGAPRVAAGVGRPGQRPPHVADAEALVAGVARDAARLGLALDDEHVARLAPAQLERGREARRTAAHDDDRHGALRSSCAASSAPQ